MHSVKVRHQGRWGKTIAPWPYLKAGLAKAPPATAGGASISYWTVNVAVLLVAVCELKVAWATAE